MIRGRKVIEQIVSMVRMLVFFLFLIGGSIAFSQTRYKKALYLDTTSMQPVEYSVKSICKINNGNIVALASIDTIMSAILCHVSVTIMHPNGNTISSFLIYNPGGLRPVKALATPDGGFMVCLIEINYIWVSGDLILAKFDAAGSLLWTQRYDNAGIQYYEDMVMTQDGNYLISGNNQAASIDIILLKVSPSGNLIWAKTYPLSDNQTESTIHEMPNGDIVLGCVYWDTVFVRDLIVMKFNQGGVIQWAKRIGDSTSNHLFDIDSYGSDIIISGYTGTPPSFSYQRGGFLGRISANGNPVWIRCDTSLSGWMPNKIVKLPDQKFVASGRIYSPIQTGYMPALRKFDAFGSMSWFWDNAQFSSARITGTEMVLMPDSGIICATTQIGMIFRTNSGGSSGCHEYPVSYPVAAINFTFTSLNLNGIMLNLTPSVYQLSITPGMLNEIWFCINALENDNQGPLDMNVFPSPASGDITISVKETHIQSVCIFNGQGRCIWRAGGLVRDQIAISVSDWPEGIYYCCIRTIKGEIRRKFLIAR